MGTDIYCRIISPNTPLARASELTLSESAPVTVVVRSLGKQMAVAHIRVVHPTVRPGNRKPVPPLRREEHVVPTVNAEVGRHADLRPSVA